MAAQTSLFRYVLGKKYDSLPPPLRALLAGGERRRYRGLCQVTRGSGLVSRLAGALTGLPRKTIGEAPVVLEIVPRGTRETWIRHFPDRRMVTDARPKRGVGRGRMAERSGGVSLDMEVTVDRDAVALQPKSARFLGVPLPRFLAPRIDSAFWIEEKLLTIESDVHLPAGRLIRYRLSLDPTPMRDDEPIKPAAGPLEEASAPLVGAGTGDASPGPPTEPGSAGPRPADADARTQPVRPSRRRSPPEPAEPGAAVDDKDATMVQPAPTRDEDETIAVIHSATGEREDSGKASETGPAQAPPGQTTKPVSPSRRRPRRDSEDAGPRD